MVVIEVARLVTGSKIMVVLRGRFERMLGEVLRSEGRLGA